MIHEVYHPNFSDDLTFLAQMLGKRKFHICLVEIDKAIEQVLENPTKAAILQYPPLQGYRKKKFFSVPRPHKRQRPNMRLLYRYAPEENTVYFLAVGLRIVSRPKSPNDIYQRTRKKDLNLWEE